jgi:hypothetical protein
MEFTIPAYAKTISATLKARHLRRETPAPAPRAVQPQRRPLGRFFRRNVQPTVFHRCLAVHMHFAQRHSALD